MLRILKEQVTTDSCYSHLQSQWDKDPAKTALKNFCICYFSEQLGQVYLQLPIIYDDFFEE